MLVRKMVSMSEKHGPAKMTDCPKRRPRTVMPTGKPYMLSLTFNGPLGAFDRPDEYLFQGKLWTTCGFPFTPTTAFSVW